MNERASLISVLKGRLEFCPKEQRYAGHYYRWTPLEGQGYGFANVPTKGRYLIVCGYGCGYDREVTLTGDEVWIA